MDPLEQRTITVQLLKRGEQMGWSWYDVCDPFYESYAERQKKKYWNLMSQLDRSIRNIQNTLNSVDSIMDSLFYSFYNQGTNNSGYFADEFLYKAHQQQSKFNSLVNKMISSVGELKSKRSIAQREYNYWCEVCEREDREKREYQP
jgi:hypothetical protein